MKGLEGPRGHSWACRHRGLCAAPPRPRREGRSAPGWPRACSVELRVPYGAVPGRAGLCRAVLGRTGLCRAVPGRARCMPGPRSLLRLGLLLAAARAGGRCRSRGWDWDRDWCRCLPRRAMHVPSAGSGPTGLRFLG